MRTKTISAWVQHIHSKTFIRGQDQKRKHKLFALLFLIICKLVLSMKVCWKIMKMEIKHLKKWQNVFILQHQLLDNWVWEDGKPLECGIMRKVKGKLSRFKEMLRAEKKIISICRRQMTTPSLSLSLSLSHWHSWAWAFKKKCCSIYKVVKPKWRAVQTMPWGSLVKRDEGCIGPSCKLLCLWQTAINYSAHSWHHSTHVWLLDQSVANLINNLCS